MINLANIATSAKVRYAVELHDQLLSAPLGSHFLRRHLYIPGTLIFRKDLLVVGTLSHTRLNSGFPRALNNAPEKGGDVIDWGWQIIIGMGKLQCKM